MTNPLAAPSLEVTSLRAITPVHMAKLVSPNGDVSPLCATEPRALNLKVETWTNRQQAVTCRRCKRRLEAA